MDFVDSNYDKTNLLIFNFFLLFNIHVTPSFIGQREAKNCISKLLLDLTHSCEDMYCPLCCQEEVLLLACVSLSYYQIPNALNSLITVATEA